MVRFEYKSAEEVETGRVLFEKKDKAKGLAKKTFGFFVSVSDSVLPEAFTLSSSFHLSFSADVAVVDVSRNTLRLMKPEYELRAVKFGAMYQERFGNELTIQADYSEPKK